MPGPESDRTRKAQEALAKVAGEWMSRPGVVAVEVARRWRSGAPTDEVGIRVTVEPDRGGGAGFPGALEGIPVDVVEGKPPRPEG